VGDELGRHGQRRRTRATRGHQRLARAAEAQPAPQGLGVRRREDRAERADRGVAAGGAITTAPVPGFRFEHPAADGADDEGGLETVVVREPRVVERLARGGESESVRARATMRAPDAVGDLGGDLTAKAFTLDERDGTDRARARRDPRPEGLDAGPERADGPETGDDD